MSTLELVQPEKKARRMKQPTKDYIRAELKLAEAEIDQLRNELARARLPWWGRFVARFFARYIRIKPNPLSKDPQ